MGCLVEAVRRWDVQEVARLLAAGANPNVRDLYGDAPLHIAAVRCRADLAELLLRHGADPNMQDGGNETPLERAAGSCCVEVAELLLRHGADVTKATPSTRRFRAAAEPWRSFCSDTAQTQMPGTQTERRLSTLLCR
jgi:ankyrin repeat protein